MLAATAVGGAKTAATMTKANAAPVKSDITFDNPNDPPQGAINAKNPRSIADRGPQNPAIGDQFPAAFSPAGDGRRRHAAELGIVQQRADPLRAGGSQAKVRFLRSAEESHREHARTRNEKMRAVDHVTIGVTTEQP